MKRLIAVLLVMGVIMTAFASDVEQITLRNQDEQEASKITVSLTLSGSHGKVWFSIGRGNDAITNYDLTMQAPNELVTDLDGNTGEGTSPKVFATSASESSGNGLYLNWNIVSAAEVSVSLEITEPMVRTGAERSTDKKDKIGWSVTSDGKTLSVNDEGHVSIGKAVVHKTDSKIYGEASSQFIEVETDNVWGKNNGTYTATLIAYISTGV